MHLITEQDKIMNKDNLMKIDIQIVNNTPTPRPTPTPTPLPTPLPMPTPIPMPAPSPSESVDPDYEEGIVLTEEDRYNYELDQSELLAEERRNEEYHGVSFTE